MSGRLDGKVAFITGGASGIGRRTAEVFVSEGANIAIADRNEKLLAEVASELGADRCLPQHVDVTSEEQVERALDDVVEHFGALDAAVNCAGFGTFAPVHDHPADAWRSVLDVCLTGVFHAVKHETRIMHAQGIGGSVVNIASISGRQPGEGMAAYCSAKAGVEMLTRVAALELGRHGIRVNAVSPGFIETPLTELISQIPEVEKKFLDTIPVGRAGRPEDIARAALFLASDESSFVTGEIIVVDGGGMLGGFPRMF